VNGVLSPFNYGKQLISLLDLADRLFVDVWLVFRKGSGATTHPWLKWVLWPWIKPEFQHVEVWRCDRHVWIRFDPCLEVGLLQAYLDPPWAHFVAESTPTYLRVRRVVDLCRIRSPFMVGAVTCVSGVKMVLGLRAAFVRTPYQLYKHLLREMKR